MALFLDSASDDEGSQKRPLPSQGAAAVPEHSARASKRRAAGLESKQSKGLKHASMKVMEKVEQKGRTTYNEVADELVEEYTSGKGLSATEQSYEGKNIRRRVYDILNVSASRLCFVLLASVR